MDIIFPNLGIEIESLDRVAFSIFGFNIYWYGIFICFGTLIGVALCMKEAERTGQNKDVYMDFVFWCLLSGIVGARLYYLVFHGDSLLEFFAIRNGGLAIYGGVLGGLIAGIIYSKVKKVSFPKFADTIIMSVLCGQIVGRWGNFFNREAFGGATKSLFSMCYKISDVGGARLIGDYVQYNNASYPVTAIEGTNYIQVHPTFLYESMWNLCLLIVLFIFRKHKRFDGELTLFYLAGYGVGRFLIESLRTDQLEVFGIPVSMLVAAASVVVAASVEFYMIKKLKKNKNNA